MDNVANQKHSGEGIQETEYVMPCAYDYSGSRFDAPDLPFIFLAGPDTKILKL